MIFSIHNIDNKSLSFVSTKQIGTYYGDISNEIVFNIYRKIDQKTLFNDFLHLVAFHCF